MITVYGSRMSPFVRKVLLCLSEKHLSHQIVEFSPLNKPDKYEAISPMGRMPAIRVGEFSLADSSAICGFLEKSFPQPSLYPENPQAFGKTLWYEEFADSDFFPATAPVFLNRVVRPMLFSEPCIEEQAQHALDVSIPEFFRHIETALQDRDYLTGDTLSIADIAMFCPFPNMVYAGARISKAKWPVLSAYIERLVQRPGFEQVLGQELGECPVMPGYFVAEPEWFQ